MADKVTIVDKWMGIGNAPKDAGEGEFPVLLLSDGSRYVGRKEQTFKELKVEAVRLGRISK